MSVLERLASVNGRNDETLNQALASELCAAAATEAVAEDIQELVDALHHKDKHIRSDCIKVLYEVGACAPTLIEPYVDEFVALLSHKDNRLVWGAMTALGTIANAKAAEIWPHVEQIIDATRHGSVITQDWGVRVLAALSANDATYATEIFPFLMSFLANCRPKDVPRHAESILIAANTPDLSNQLRDVLETHLPDLNNNQTKRVRATLKQL